MADLFIRPEYDMMSDLLWIIIMVEKKKKTIFRLRKMSLKFL